ncbi:Avirulence protein [Phytophthora megakarya]|uniref:Avirulence protein n=1 Tax=Phytophthora megakarya TaxID=4795 RepID=A0A225UQE9_9STRA|nr:Avirulence protein [Phytophthora megakarya]
MQLSCNFIATVAIAVAIFDASPASATSTGIAQNANSRILRSDKNDTYNGDLHSDEDRVGLISSIWSKLLKIDPDSLKKLEDEIYELMVKAKELQGKNIDLFRKIDETGVHPLQMKQKFGIDEKLKTMSKTQLKNDGDYLLWRDYSRYVTGDYGKKLEKLNTGV